MTGYKRTDRVGDQIRMEIADILMRRVKDPRVGFVTVTGVDLSADLKHAWVYLTVLAEGEREAETLAALGRACGFIRTELGRRLQLRSVPDLTFVKDTSVDRAMRVLNLIEGVHRAEEAPAQGKDERSD
jgi:ribosome-binding factor A